MVRFFAVGLFAITATSAGAKSMESIQLAGDLGSVLAAEKPCGFAYDQAAISAWIDENVDPSDMGFASALSTMTTGASYQMEEMSESALTAHCRATERAAKHYGFMQ